ncbi:ribonuclease E inhibitor RraB [Rhizobacter sp. AJA081-3]|uniref:ribonuclease E inhibitor RraB n=1 Tax=Rhizobacter sp. AJA081-3 TaxID=2753607 RepID=UPI001ADFA88C|nr:ribonuclease E inhibitor RraB [Rhizobacter sp. AJA081-3]QTN21520.1 ribonuclease E inhibitor RraB [Rhizobacter sp. AJA081-3]
MIELSQLEEMFESIRAAGRWNMTEPMLWGYFFTDPSAEKLRAIVSPLEQAGYRFVDLFEADSDDDSDPYFFLHVEREEVHSVQSLHDRNVQLEAFADQNDIATYDGMDVGPVLGRQ